MVPSGSGQKLKLVTSGPGMQSVQYVRASNDQVRSAKEINNQALTLSNHIVLLKLLSFSAAEVIVLEDKIVLDI